jgi:hypothetical protein
MIRHFFRGLFCLMLITASLQPVKAHQIDNVVLEVIGFSGAIVVYNTYELIDAIAIAYESGAMDTERATTMLTGQADLMKLGVAQYNKLAASGTLHDPADVSSINDFRDACGNLQFMAEALKEMILEGGDVQIANYDDAREDAWEKVKAILGLP